MTKNLLWAVLVWTDGLAVDVYGNEYEYHPPGYEVVSIHDEQKAAEEDACWRTLETRATIVVEQCRTGQTTPTS